MKLIINLNTKNFEHEISTKEEIRGILSQIKPIEVLTEMYVTLYRGNFPDVRRISRIQTKRMLQNSEMMDIFIMNFVI